MPTVQLNITGDATESNDTDPDDQTGESTADERYFVHQDRNWNVTALSEYDSGGSNNGRIVERIKPTPAACRPRGGGDNCPDPREFPLEPSL